MIDTELCKFSLAMNVLFWLGLFSGIGLGLLLIFLVEKHKK
jgi:hypothetical protein